MDECVSLIRRHVHQPALAQDVVDHVQHAIESGGKSVRQFFDREDVTRTSSVDYAQVQLIVTDALALMFFFCPSRVVVVRSTMVHLRRRAFVDVFRGRRRSGLLFVPGLPLLQNEVRIGALISCCCSLRGLRMDGQVVRMLKHAAPGITTQQIRILLDLCYLNDVQNSGMVSYVQLMQVGGLPITERRHEVVILIVAPLQLACEMTT